MLGCGERWIYLACRTQLTEYTSIHITRIVMKYVASLYVFGVAVAQQYGQYTDAPDSQSPGSFITITKSLTGQSLRMNHRV